MTGRSPLILGSGSPRRSQLLASLGVPFVVRVASVDEAALMDADIEGSVERSALAKFDALAIELQNEGDAEVQRQLLTADTLVGAGGHVLGKPADDDHAREMLAELSGAALNIVSALCVASPDDQPVMRTVATTVTLRALAADEITAYVATGAARDKAGALELQGRAASFMDSIDGCWSNVVGLPLCAVREMLDIEPAEPCSGVGCGRSSS